MKGTQGIAFKFTHSLVLGPEVQLDKDEAAVGVGGHVSVVED